MFVEHQHNKPAISYLQAALMKYNNKLSMSQTSWGRPKMDPMKIDKELILWYMPNSGQISFANFLTLNVSTYSASSLPSGAFVHSTKSVPMLLFNW